jgi:hypothetical protein
MVPTPQPVLLEILAHVPTDFFHCLHCERLFDMAGIGAPVHGEMQADYPSHVVDEAARLATWLQDLSARYGEQLHVRIIDPQSLEGFFKSLRYWVRRYPTFIIDRRTKHIGWELAALEQLLADQVHATRRA